jgi:dihydropteroate synthase-like protein
MPEHILFLTGKLAEKSLNRVLQSIEPLEFTYEVLNIGVSVAALITAEMINRRLDNPRNASRILVPGLCAGDLEIPAKKLGVPVARGPEDLKDLPEFFGRGGQPPDLSRYDIQIFAEVVDAPHITIEAILRRAEVYRRDGANVIDLGCLPGTPFPHLEEAVIALKEQGFQVSLDSHDTEDLLRGGQAGADYLLSLKESTLWVADEVASVPILVPEQAGDMASLCRAMDALIARDKRFIADCILDPIHFGFTESIVRYHELRRRYPDAEIMMGTGNLSELTDADTAGMNALMLGMMSELHITHLLTTEVSPHARSVVREADLARRIMYLAREENRLPRGYDGSLATLHERRPFPYSEAEIAETAAQIRDPSYRIQVSETGVHVYNRDGMLTATDPFELFPKLTLLEKDAPHAFYMGVELGRAQIAWQLGKRFLQDEGLKWGRAFRDPGVPETSKLHAYKGEGSTLEAKKKRKKHRDEP